MEHQLQKQLLLLFDHLFAKQSLERNTYFFNQMKSNLEIALTLIYKERKVQALTQDHKYILQTLKKCNKVAVNEQTKTLRIKLKPIKSKLIVSNVLLENQLQTMLREINPNITYVIQTDQNNNFFILFNNEIEAAEIHSYLKLKCECRLEDADPYQLMKQNIEKVKNQKKYAKSNNFYETQRNMPSQYNYSNWMTANYNNMQMQRGPGFTRKAIESDEEEQRQIFAKIPVSEPILESTNSQEG